MRTGATRSMDETPLKAGDKVVARTGRLVGTVDSIADGLVWAEYNSRPWLHMLLSYRPHELVKPRRYQRYG